VGEGPLSAARAMGNVTESANLSDVEVGKASAGGSYERQDLRPQLAQMSVWRRQTRRG
jgi:hypothetical protein